MSRDERGTVYLTLGVVAAILVTSFVVSEVTRGESRSAGSQVTFVAQPTTSAAASPTGDVIVVTPDGTTTTTTRAGQSPVASFSAAPVPISVPGPRPAEVGVDLALGRSTSCSSSQGADVASNVADGDAASVWRSRDGAAFPQWVQVDLGSVTQISKIVLTLPPGTPDRTETFVVYGLATYTTGGLLTLAADSGYTFSPVSGDVITLRMSAVGVRWIQVEFTAGQPTAELSEIEVYA